MQALNRYICYLFVLGILYSGAPDHLIFNRVCVKPNQAEMIEIYNPLDTDVDLSNYYLSDSDKYYQWINGESIGNFDFLIKFPTSSIIKSKKTFVITTQSISEFDIHYDYEPDISIIDTNFEEVEFGINPNLSASEEMLILFYWDGISSIVQDVDYFLWGDYEKGFSKTIDDGYPYNDTPLEEQNFIRTYSLENFNDSLYVRVKESYDDQNGNEEYDDGEPFNVNEYNETQSQGNGITGHDETSEDFILSWTIDGYPTSTRFQNITSGIYECDGDSKNACPLGSYYPDCPVVNPVGMIVDYIDVTPYGGPHAITIEDSNGYRVELTIWPDEWDIENDPEYSQLLDPPYSRFLVQGFGNVFEYDGEQQIIICSPDELPILQNYDMEGQYIIEENGEYYDFKKASIDPAPFVLVPSADEVLDYSYSFPSNSRVIIRVFDISGRFITTLTDKYYPSSGIVKREEFYSAWDGTDHIGQVLPPGTYLMHMEASNFQTGKTSIDIAPVVIGVQK